MSPPLKDFNAKRNITAQVCKRQQTRRVEIVIENTTTDVKPY
jgi:hypothetical protein